MKSRNINQIKAYAYFLVRLADNKKYVGIRYKNIRECRLPEEDFGKFYFSSGSFKKQFKSNPENFKFIIKYVFDSIDEAYGWELKITKKIYRRYDWANQNCGGQYKDNPEIGRLISEGKSKIDAHGKTSIDRGAEALKKFLYETEEGSLLRKEISERKKGYWGNLSDSQKKKIVEKRLSSYDVYEASKKSAETMSIPQEDGLTIRQKAAKKVSDYYKNNPEIATERAKNRNLAKARKYGEMSEEEFENSTNHLSDRLKKGLLTLRKKYLLNRGNTNDVS